MYAEQKLLETVVGSDAVFLWPSLRQAEPGPAFRLLFPLEPLVHQPYRLIGLSSYFYTFFEFDVVTKLLTTALWKSSAYSQNICLLCFAEL